MTLNQTEVLFQVRLCFGTACNIESFRQFKGGARKQVYFLRLSHPNTQCVMYIWNNEANYFAERVAGGFEETQTDEQAPALFLSNTPYLLENGVNVPQLLYSGTVDSGHHFAFVEQIIGSDFNAFAATASDPERQAVLRQISAQLARLHALPRVYPGALQAGPDDQYKLPQDAILDRAFLEVEATAEAQLLVAEHRQQIRDKLQALWAQISPRSTYHLVHGELAGSHVLVRERDQTVYFVDIEGLHCADLEFEHTFRQWV
jgi:hypothetical protein